MKRWMSPNQAVGLGTIVLLAALIGCSNVQDPVSDPEEVAGATPTSFPNGPTLAEAPPPRMPPAPVVTATLEVDSVPLVPLASAPPPAFSPFDQPELICTHWQPVEEAGCLEGNNAWFSACPFSDDPVPFPFRGTLPEFFDQYTVRNVQVKCVEPLTFALMENLADENQVRLNMILDAHDGNDFSELRPPLAASP